MNLAKTPTRPTLAQERILAEEQCVQNNRNISHKNHTKEEEGKITERTLRIASFNVKGMNFIAARQQLMYLMNKHNIDIAALQETHVNYTGKEIHGDYTFYFSSCIEDEHRKQTEIHLENLKKKVKKKEITEEQAKRERMTILNKSSEKLGVAFVFKHGLFRSQDVNITSVDNRIIEMQVNTRPIQMHLTNVYAPHAGHTFQLKTDFYDKLHDILQRQATHTINLVLGDFNARIMEVLPQEKNLIGEHIYCSDTSYINDLPQGQLDNRQHFINLCIDHNRLPMNTWFSKPRPKLATYRAPTALFFESSNIDVNKFAQIDYILINRQWRNAVQDVEHIHHTLLDSDHALLIAKIKVKLADKRKIYTKTRNKFRDPTDNELCKYNQLFQQGISQHISNGTWLTKDKGDIIANAAINAAYKSLTKIPAHQKKDYISERTWNMIQEKQKVIDEGNFERIPALTRNIKWNARLDKERMLTQQLEEADAHGYKWEGLKAARKGFQPNRTKFRNTHGDLIKESDFPFEAAKYLETIQWAHPADNTINPAYENKFLYNGNHHMSDTNFSKIELDRVIKAQKQKKTPGPDNCPAELIKWLNDDNRNFLLDCYNDILETNAYPDSFKLANIVSIYKKGDATKMQNYRPISLLQVLYKIFAGLIKNRLIETYDPWIQQSQFGFRPKKSTTQAIFIARRLMDMAERTGSNLSIILLDWKMAFDKVNQEKLMQVLRRLRIPPRMLIALQHIYDNPKFRVATQEHQSDYFIQHSGIRQGCPLSPYLFVLLMSALFCDIKDRLNTPKQKEPIEGLEYTEVLYADDTLIFGNHTQNINRHLKEIQVESKYYNMELNLDKCINITINRKQSSVKYVDGTLVPRKKTAMYLGTTLTDTVDNHNEIMNRLTACTRTADRLKLFWNKANTTVKWKIQVFHAIVRSKLLYGLETLQLSVADQNRINSFQIKSYRRILHIPPTSIDRTKTNEFVTTTLRTQHQVHVRKFSDLWLQRKITLLGHIIRSDPSDPMRQVLFEIGTLTPRIEFKKRVGKPRIQWLSATYEDAYKNMGYHTPFDFENSIHRTVVNNAAQQRISIFSK